MQTVTNQERQGQHGDFVLWIGFASMAVILFR